MTVALHLTINVIVQKLQNSVAIGHANDSTVGSQQLTFHLKFSTTKKAVFGPTLISKLTTNLQTILQNYIQQNNSQTFI